MTGDARGAREKALEINLDGIYHGTFAEIGAGQETARWFFHVGKSSATIARSISAYDMAISDALYGPTRQYVSRARLGAMLDHEYDLLIRRLTESRGGRNAFFVFADTVATHGSARASGGHGWLGIRFETHPGSGPSEVIIHIEMLDAFTASQQETVGLVGVNLVYAAFNWHQDPCLLIRRLVDGLDRRRVEIDMIKFSGPAFAGLDNRLMSLQLLEQGLTDAAMFTAGGEVVQPSEVLHDHPVVIGRGSFRPVTNVSLDMLDSALSRCQPSAEDSSGPPLAVMEMTLNNLMTGPSIDYQDFLARVDLLGALDKTVLISNYTRFDCVTTYLRQYTPRWIGFAAGVPTVHAIFDEKYYRELPGGILEGLGRLFRGPVELFVYPTISRATGVLETAGDLSISPKLKHLYAHLFENGFIRPVEKFDREQLKVTPGDVLKKIQAGDPGWVNYVPAPAAALIQKNQLFGFNRA